MKAKNSINNDYDESVILENIYKNRERKFQELNNNNDEKIENNKIEYIEDLDKLYKAYKEKTLKKENTINLNDTDVLYKANSCVKTENNKENILDKLRRVANENKQLKEMYDREHGKIKRGLIINN